MLSRIHSGCVMGIEAYAVDVEIDVAGGLPSFSVIGLPDTSIRESRDRIRSAIKNSGFSFPAKRITVNLSPADVKKEGAGFDLPIALGILAATGLIEQEKLDAILFRGELSLNGKLKHFRGALPLAISLKDKYKTFIVPKATAIETANVGGIEVFGAGSLREVVEHLKDVKQLKAVENVPRYAASRNRSLDVDFSDVKGQDHVKRGLEVAASGGHNVLMIGPPGSGKSMLAKRFGTILPHLSYEESLETTKIYSTAGQLKHMSLLEDRPFRSPHHTISYAAMVGGGQWAAPGEISLAHNGVLFLDEFPEFRRDVLETLRQPIESGEVTISRVERSLTYPCRFILISAMNPCPCGYFTDPKKECRCSPHQIQRYLSKISGPLLDRIDIHLEVPRLDYNELSGKRNGKTSEEIRTRVERTRNIQIERARIQGTKDEGRRTKDDNSRIRYNASLDTKDVERFCILSKDAEELLKTAILELGISARAYDKILKISRTIADMETSETIESHHVSEAIGYRSLDRSLWT